jgi:hypothetical protein
MSPADGITVRQKSRALFQRYRPVADVVGCPRFGHCQGESEHDADFEFRRLMNLSQRVTRAGECLLCAEELTFKRTRIRRLQAGERA